MKIGLLPFYVKLYDDVWPDTRKKLEPFLHELVQGFEQRGIDVQLGAICTVKNEFEREINSFEENGVQALVTYHLAYSPSLESIEALVKTSLPIIVMDTTPTLHFGKTQNPSAIDNNHGIHGVQDMCSLLKRYSKPFLIEAGHYAESDIFDRVINDINAAVIANSLKNARVGIIGKPFAGMGDFQVGFNTLKETIGFEVLELNGADAKKLYATVSPSAVETELKNDNVNYEMSGLSQTVAERSIKTALAVRKWLSDNNLSAFTANFMDIIPELGLECMPFYEASKAMSRGIGYAGEGDVLTAALTGSLMKVYPATSFAEIFCPDWQGGTLFLSHMGEFNVDLSAKKPYVEEKEFPFTDAQNPAVIYGCFKSGNAVLVNIAPTADGKYALIISEVEMTDQNDNDSFKNTVRGWFKPKLPLERFLEAYSYAGGTHHCTLCYDADIDVIKNAGKLLGFNIIEI